MILERRPGHVKVLQVPGWPKWMNEWANDWIRLSLRGNCLYSLAIKEGKSLLLSRHDSTLCSSYVYTSLLQKRGTIYCWSVATLPSVLHMFLYSLAIKEGKSPLLTWKLASEGLFWNYADLISFNCRGKAYLNCLLEYKLCPTLFRIYHIYLHIYMRKAHI